MAPITINGCEEIAMSEVETNHDANGSVDAIAALVLITIVIASAIFWLTNQ